MEKEKKHDEAKHDNRKKGLLLIVSAFVFFMAGKLLDEYCYLPLLTTLLNIAAFICVVLGLASLVGEVDFSSSENAQERVSMEKSKEYNNYQYTCPMCGKHRIKNIGTGKKVAGVIAVGLASKNIGKNYQCQDCGYRW